MGHDISDLVAMHKNAKRFGDVRAESNIWKRILEYTALRNELARDEIWGCRRCGKLNPNADKWDFEGAAVGWDESCALNAVRVRKSEVQS